MKDFTTAVFLGTALILLMCQIKDSAYDGDKYEVRESSPLQYYSLKDFGKVRKIDIHIHINTLDDSFLKLAEKDNFWFLDIVDDRPFGVPMKEQQDIAVTHLSKNPHRMRFATTFPVADWEDPGWVDSTLSRLNKSFEQGAVAVKIWKNIGMDLRDSRGRFVMVDHPRIDTILRYLEVKDIPVIGHNGEPKDCWLPLDAMTFSKGYYSAHPEYHMYLHPDYPSYVAQIKARDNLLKKHPRLHFMGAHLGSLEWSLEELSERLDAFPNMYVDLTRISNLKLHTLTDRTSTRNFFIKYQDRLIYGTDTAINDSESPGERNKGIHEDWVKDWIFFVTGDQIHLPNYGQLKGLKLPRQVVDKIYYKNARQFLDWKIN